jgi:hypothetical protein
MANELSPWDNLAPNQVMALHALATARTINEAASNCDVSRETIRQWLLRDEPFRAAYRAIKVEAFENLSLAMLQLGDRAITAWHTVLDNPSERGMAILAKTASDIVSNLLKLRETMEFEARIEALEAAYRGAFDDD